MKTVKCSWKPQKKACKWTFKVCAERNCLISYHRVICIFAGETTTSVLNKINTSCPSCFLFVTFSLWKNTNTLISSLTEKNLDSRSTFHFFTFSGTFIHISWSSSVDGVCTVDMENSYTWMPPHARKSCAPIVFFRSRSAFYALEAIFTDCFHSRRFNLS